MKNCFLCQRPVLALEGEYGRFEEYLLREQDEVYQKNLYGDAHASCLMESKWGVYWYNTLLKQYEGRMAYQRHRLDDWNFLISPRRDVTFLHAHGFKYDLPDGFEKLPRMAHGDDFLIQVDREWVFELPELNQAKELRSQLESKGSVSGLELAALIGTADKVANELIMNKTRLSFDADLAPQNMDQFVAGKLTHFLFVPRIAGSVMGFR